MSQELKNQCKKVMLEHLESIGYPNVQSQTILQELLPMWKKLDEASLVEQVKGLGWTFQQFQEMANRVAQETAIIEQFEYLGGILKRKKK